MPSYTLNIEVGPDHVAQLREKGYKLVIAKNVNDAYRVVWVGLDEFLQRNQLEWTDEYQAGALVTRITNVVEIQYGQTATLTKSGTMTLGTLNVQNDYGTVNIGVSQKLGRNFLPTFVSDTLDIGPIALTPISKVKVWFALNVKTSSMITDAESSAIEVDFTDETTQSIAYRGGAWSNVNDTT